MTWRDDEIKDRMDYLRLGTSEWNVSMLGSHSSRLGNVYGSLTAQTIRGLREQLQAWRQSTPRCFQALGMAIGNSFQATWPSGLAENCP